MSNRVPRVLVQFIFAIAQTTLEILQNMLPNMTNFMFFLVLLGFYECTAYEEPLSKKLYQASVATYCKIASVTDWSCSACKQSLVLTKIRTFNKSSQSMMLIGKNEELKAVVIVFRGDPTLDLVAPKVIWDDTSAVYDNCAGCMVNKAAYTKYMLYESELLGQLKLYLDDTYKTVIVTGFSIGAMYATYAVGSILTKQAAIVSTFYTFGSPKTGNPNFVKWLTAKIGDTVARARVTNGADPSVKWIKNPFYRHLSKEVYYHQNNKSTFRECVDEKDEDNKCSVKNWKGDYKDHRSYFQTDFVKVVKECQ